MASLSDAGGGGRITNGLTTLSAVLTLSPQSGTSSFSGVIDGGSGKGSISVVKSGSGTQAYMSGLTRNPGGTYVWELNALTEAAGTNQDLLAVTGGLNLRGLSTEIRLNVDLVTLTGRKAARTLDLRYVPPRLPDISVKVNLAGTGISLVFVPEPGAIALVAIGVAVVGWSAVRKRRRAW